MEHKHKAPVLPCWTSEQGVCTTVTNSALWNEATEEMRRRASVTCDTSLLSANQRNDFITKPADSIRMAPGTVRYHRHNYTRLVISFQTNSTGWPKCARRFSLQNYTQDVRNVLVTWQLAWMLAEYIGLDNKMLHYVSCRILHIIRSFKWNCTSTISLNKISLRKGTICYTFINLSLDMTSIMEYKQ